MTPGAVDRAASAVACAQMSEPPERRSSICTQSTWISLRLTHSRLDNCANSRAVIHTLHSCANTDPYLYFFFFEKTS